MTAEKAASRDGLSTVRDDVVTADARKRLGGKLRGCKRKHGTKDEAAPMSKPTKESVESS